MQNSNTLRSDEETVPDEANLLGSKTNEINRIRQWYKENMLEGMDAADAQRRLDLVTQWYEWCDRKYPSTRRQDWPDVASAAGEDVDIRLLMRGHSIAGYAILLFLEACYAVDKALCGTDIEALAKVKVWHMPQEMRAYKYLLSEEMAQWWAIELGELENEIKSPISNRVLLSLRIAELNRCVARLQVVLREGEGIETNIWTTMEENETLPPADLSDAIHNRFDNLNSSVEILNAALKQSKQGNASSDILSATNHTSVELSG